jgi:hypothetical protein
MTTPEAPPEFNTDHLNVDLEFLEASTPLLLDVFVGLEVGLLAPGDGIVTDRHHASSDRYEADGTENQIGVQFSPVRQRVDVMKGQPEAYYRQLNTQVRSRNAADEGQPLRQATRAVVGNLVDTWRLTLRECHPEFVGMLLIQAVSMEAVQHE